MFMAGRSGLGAIVGFRCRVYREGGENGARRAKPMSTINRPKSPPLKAGQRLDRATFHERYEAMPPETRAELIGGLVYMPSPLSLGHGRRDTRMTYWLGHSGP